MSFSFVQLQSNLEFIKSFLFFIITFLFMKQQHHKNMAKTNYDFILGPVKIKDGLFMGDELAAKDIEFIINNKVTHVINTVSKQIPNLWERYGIQYLSVNWTEKQQNIFDKKNNALNAIFHFIEEAMQQGQSCLVHSVNGKSRACTVMVAYMMKKFNWSLDKCLEFINTKKQHLEVRNGFLVQLQEFEKRLSQIYNLTSNWQQAKNQDDLILKNTFINSKAAQACQKTQIKSQKKKVSWAEKPVVIMNNNKMASTTTNFTKIREKQNQKERQPMQLKSILKGDQDSDQQKSDIKMKDSNFNINGNIVHVTVNNFITTDKPESASKNVANSRPFSSDTKQRERQKKYEVMSKTTGKMFPYDNMISNFKSPYQNKTIGTKIGSFGKLTKKKQQQFRSPLMTYERPQSANIAAERRKMKVTGPVVSNKKQEMVVTGKKRYPSSNPRQELYKWK